MSEPDRYDVFDLIDAHYQPDSLGRVLRNFEEVYKSIVNEWALYDNSFATPILIKEGANP